MVFSHLILYFCLFFVFKKSNLTLFVILFPVPKTGKKKDPVAFGWNERYKVALGVAEALDYLHSGNSQPVIHGDVKSSNILLSDDFEPQVMKFLIFNFSVS